MRTTLDIDDRVLALARGRARLKGITLGQAVSELALAGAGAETDVPTGATPEHYGMVRHPRTGLPYFPAVPGHVITQELIDEVLDEMDEEEARAGRDS